MNPRDVALKCITQALDPAVGEHEGRTFAMKAVRIIAEHKLLAPSTVGAGGSAEEAPTGNPLEGFLNNLSTIALGASTIEILSLREEARRLRQENAHLRSQIRMSAPSYKKKRRRVR